MKFVKWKFDNFWENFKLTRSIETNEFLFESFDWRILISRLFVGQKRANFEKKNLLEYFLAKNNHFHKQIKLQISRDLKTSRNYI